MSHDRGCPCGRESHEYEDCDKADCPHRTDTVAVGAPVLDMSRVLHNIVQSRAGGATQRCHGIRHLGSYSNAEHTWGVLLLLQHLYPDHFPVVAPYALTHDVPEYIWGDVPAPSMRYIPGLREQLGRYEDALNAELGNHPEGVLERMDPERFRILKSCDRLELWFWCREQLLMGNRFAGECLVELERYFEGGALEARADGLWRHARVLDGTSALLPSQAGVAERIVNKLEAER